MGGSGQQMNRCGQYMNSMWMNSTWIKKKVTLSARKYKYYLFILFDIEFTLLDFFCKGKTVRSWNTTSIYNY